MASAALSNVNDPVMDMITNARVKLLFEQPFFGTLALGMEVVDASEWCPTAATDGRNLFYNRDFVKNMPPGQLKFLIGHELLHCVYDHIGRRGSRDAKIWNMANDYIVNYTLVAEKCGEMPPSGLYNRAYTDDLTSEEVYNLLLESSTEIKMPLDMHLDMVGPGGAECDSGSAGDGVTVRVLGKNGPPVLTQDDIDAMREEIRTAIIRTAQSLGADKVPGALRRLIGDLIEPKLDWRALLDAHIRSAIKDDYSFQNLSRRTRLGGFIFPGQDFQDTVDISIAVDASGSLSTDQLRDIMSECKGIMETFRDFKIKLWSFDTSVHNFVEIGPENISEFDTWTPGGGGGTTFEVNWDFMKDQEIAPMRLVMFTDGLPGGGWGDPDYCDTLFVIHGDRHIKAPFGITAYYEDKVT